jgi:hypothetical protein
MPPERWDELYVFDPDDLASVRAHKMPSVLEQGIKNYYTKVDQELLNHYGCLCKILEAIAAGEIRQTVHDGLWQTSIDVKVVAEMGEASLMGDFS